MRLLPKPGFIDVVSGRQVQYWADTLGRYWMAESAWSLFRVEALDGRYDAQLIQALREGK